MLHDRASSWLVSFCLGVSSCAPTSLDPVPYALSPVSRGPADFAEVSLGATVRLTPIVTGAVWVDRSVLIDLDCRGLTDTRDRKLWAPVVSYLVDHEDFGPFLVDSGLGRVTDELRVLGLARQTSGTDIGSALESLGYSPKSLKMVLLSHAHLDHVLGLPSLPRSVPVASGPGAVDSLESAGLDPFGGRSTVHELQFEGGSSAAGRSLDLFGDRSFLVLEAPGHARGNLSFVAHTESGVVLLTADASHTLEGFELGCAPGKAEDRTRARQTVERLRALALQYELVTLAGHDPEQWARPGPHDTL